MSARNLSNVSKKRHEGAKKHPNQSQQSPTKAGFKNQVFERVASLVRESDYDEAVEVLRAAGFDIQIRNALGVCLMRAGRPEEAVAVFRQFVLQADGVSERKELSNAYKRNFATALLMKGSPSGAVSVLTETHELDHPMAVRISGAIRSWAKSLSWWRRFDWKINGIEPANCHVPLDFEPGEFDFETVVRQQDLPRDGRFGLAV
ncbi:tetratricopeptide repeat protein [Rosistilla oblonga]|uniref:tetratricopeptide repeat protein n=1 Tax=Rosistilla oblonga TaxID=2527990 RepID=UPI003A978E0D